MTVCAGPDEETLRPSPVVRPFRANAFRLLSLNADAESRQIDKQQNRLLVAIELDPRRGVGAYGLTDLTQMEVNQAGFLLGHPDNRMLEELFWVHAMECDLQGKTSDILLIARSQPDGPTARHNLAVLLTITAHECDPNVWEEALKQWKSVLGDPLFWDFMKSRASHLNARKSNSSKLNAFVIQSLRESLVAQLARAGKAKGTKLVALLARIVLPHLDWLDLKTTLRSVSNQIIKEGFVTLGGTLDRVGGLRPESDIAAVHRTLQQAEKELGRVAAEYGELHRSLAGMAVEENWEKALCSTYQTLLHASIQLSGDLQQAQRIMEQAGTFVSNVHLLGPMRQELQQAQWSALLHTANALLQAGNYSAAEQKLAEAWTLSTQEQKQKVQTLQETCFFARAAAERQQYLKQNERMSEEAKESAYNVPIRARPSAPRRRARWALLAPALLCALGVALFAGHSPEEAVTTAPPATSSGPAQNPAPHSHAAEDTGIAELEQALAGRQNGLNREESELEKQRISLEAVASAYRGENVPQDGREIYDGLLEDYESKVQQHNRKLLQWRADDAAYREHVNAFHPEAEAKDRTR